MDERADQIVEELIDLAQGADEYGLVQFRSRAGAGQYALLYELFRRYVVPGGAVLDWGSGNGHFSYYLRCTGYRTTSFSVEKRPSVGQLAGGALREVQGDPREPVVLPFLDEEFDAVASVGVLEHVGKYGGDELASLREIRRVLCPGGVLVCTHLPNRYSAIEALARRTGGAYRHDRLFTTHEIRKLLDSAGLVLVEARRYGLLPRNSMGRLPLGPRRSRALGACWNGLDRVLTRLLNPVCQNYAFVARRLDSGPGLRAAGPCSPMTP